MTAWREGWEIGPKLNLGMSNQFCVRDAMEESDFMDSFPNAQIFLFFARKTTFPAKKPIASASANRAVHQRTECEKKHNRAPNRVPIREILAARRGVAYSCEGGGCGGTKGDAVLDSGCAGWCPGFFSGPLAVTVFFYSHFCILYMACLCEDPSLSGQV